MQIMDIKTKKLLLTFQKQTIGCMQSKKIVCFPSKINEIKKHEIAQKDNRNQERWVHFLYFIEKKVKFYFVERFYSSLF